MRQFIAGVVVGAGATLSAVAYAIHHYDSIDAELNTLGDKMAQHAADLREKSQAREAAREGVADGVNTNTIASLRWPANGTILSPDRKNEINNSTPDDPIVLTSEDIDAMDIHHIKIHVGSGRFLLHPDSTP